MSSDLESGRFRGVKPPSWLELEGGALPITSRLQLTAFSWKLLLRVTAGCNVSRIHRPATDRKHPLYRCSDRTYLDNRSATAAA